jgi:hypothetical protein
LQPVKSLTLFLDKLIDYAGLFPPAQLEIGPSLKNYAEYTQSIDGWMTSQFIIPVSRLHEIPVDLMETFSKKHPLALSLISGGITNEIDIVDHFFETYPEKVIFSGHESRISNLSTFTQDLLDVHQLCNNQIFAFNSFYEVGPSDNWSNEMNEAVSKISAFNTEYKANAGFKLRCGGVEAQMFPAAKNIAHTILACRNANLSMKFTAGLHHPVRHYNESVKTKMYGFFNIFIGGMVAHKYNLELDALIEILVDENPDNFTFDGNGLNWKDYFISNSEIQTYRDKSFISYGSCSFNEPRADLQKLGLL